MCTKIILRAARMIHCRYAEPVLLKRQCVSPSLYLLTPSNGKRRWAFRFTKPSTKRVTEMGLGTVEHMSFEEAQVVVGKCQLLVKLGIDPIHPRQGRITVPKDLLLDLWGRSSASGLL